MRTVAAQMTENLRLRYKHCITEPLFCYNDGLTSKFDFCKIKQGLCACSQSLAGSPFGVPCPLKNK